MTTSEQPDQPPIQPPIQQTAQRNVQPATATGRLAQVIASRGGLAPPEAPFVIEHREALIYMLCEAAELEHGIMCQYLFAAFSLKQDEGEDLTDAELAAARRWRKVIAHVSTQEMLHLALVQNLLSAIGAAPHLSRPNFPHPASHYPAGVHLALLPFGEEAVRHFMFLERPEGMDIRDADGMAAFGRAQPLMEAGDIVPRGQDFKTVGHLYRSIEEGFRHLVESRGEDWLFVGPPRAQATPEYFGWPELVPVTDLASAQRAIDEILEQGEGPRGAWQNAHFGQFVEILDEYLQAKEADLGLMAARPVQTVNVRPCDRDVEVPLVSDQVTARVRCGHSQNKPFCSGMHWYIGFTDPELAPGRVPSLFEWAGGLPALTRLTERLYDKLVPADTMLAPLFADILPGYPEREAGRIAAAFGGPRPATVPAPGNGAAAGPAAEHRARWVTLATRAADETGLPSDAAFRAAFTSFLTWDAAGALARGQAGGAPAGSGQDGGTPPAWDWSAAGPPDTTTQPDTGQPDEPVTLTGPDEPVSFKSHIKPMFRARDRQSMLFAFDLWSYDDVRGHAADVLARVANGTMPCDGSWPDGQVQVFRRWTESGTPA
ncbi:MAG TPA: ferritin-like domain-containing protein [Streptosporangiaceae bacterium]|jgi:truncated hemoglobin YjbI|nr:ferritin-like domain-containing protein [Streptosporangiaceae bacterium]